MSVKDEREHFNAVVAPTLAASVGVSARVDGARSSRFAYFADHSRFVVVAGAQEGSDVDLAFAFGITYRGDHRLVLVLPEQFSFPTMQRAPWFRADVMPDVWLHDGVKAWPVQLRSQAETIAELAVRLKPGQSFEAELREAATPVHLGARSAAVAELAEWATTHPLLDAGHRKGERAWHCMGQKVLSIKPTLHGLSVVAGIHYSKPDAAPPVDEVTIEGGIDADQLALLKMRVMAAADERLVGAAPIRRPDEHWLQAVIRRDPGLVGVEHPALRELPAWRPRVSGADGAKTGSRLHRSRQAAGLTQRGLAALARVPQPSIAELESGAQGDATVGLVERLLAACGAQLSVVSTLTPSVAAAGADLRGLVRDGHVGLLFRHLVQLSDDLAGEAAANRVALCVTPPPLTGDRGVDAFLAAVVEYRLGEDRLPVPDWTSQRERYCDPPWDVAGIASLLDDVRRNTPAPFERHGVLIAVQDLVSV